MNDNTLTDMAEQIGCPVDVLVAVDAFCLEVARRVAEPLMVKIEHAKASATPEEAHERWSLLRAELGLIVPAEDVRADHNDDSAG